MKTSQQELRVFRVLQSKRWLTSREIAREAEVAERTARAYVLRMVKAGLLERADLFPGYRYRWTGKDNADVQRLKDAAAIDRHGSSGLSRAPGWPFLLRGMVLKLELKQARAHARHLAQSGQWHGTGNMRDKQGYMIC